MVSDGLMIHIKKQPKGKEEEEGLSFEGDRQKSAEWPFSSWSKTDHKEPREREQEKGEK